MRLSEARGGEAACRNRCWDRRIVIFCLVVWNMCYFPFHIWNSRSHWLILFKMVKTTNQFCYSQVCCWFMRFMLDPHASSQIYGMWWFQFHFQWHFFHILIGEHHIIIYCLNHFLRWNCDLASTNDSGSDFKKKMVSLEIWQSLPSKVIDFSTESFHKNLGSSLGYKKNTYSQCF